MIREARLRAGLTQQELADRSGRERSVIARWEQGAVAPSLEALLAVIQACGFDLPLELATRAYLLSEGRVRMAGTSAEFMGNAELQRTVLGIAADAAL